MQIQGKREGRPGVWLITPETATQLVNELEGDHVHCFLGMIGADWQKENARELFQRPDVKLGLVFPPNFTMGHYLVAMDEEHRWSFDVGEIEESRMVEAK